MKIFKSRGNFLSDKSAQILGQFIEKEFRGTVKPKELVEAARRPSSPIHELFEWDDKVASEKYRSWQARCFIRDIEIEVIGQDHVPAFYSVKINNKKTYVGFDRASRTKSIWAQVLSDAYKELVYWKYKYGEYKQFSTVVKAINSIETKIEGELDVKRKHSYRKGKEELKGKAAKASKKDGRRNTSASAGNY